MNLTLGLALASSIMTGTSVSSIDMTTAPQAPQSQTVEEYVREYFADQPVMIEIARCESRFRQFGEDGHALKNRHSTATGAFQIMASIHADLAKDKLGLDIYSLQGNLGYAKYLYEKEGTKPWAASKHCWGKKSLVALAK